MSQSSHWFGYVFGFGVALAPSVLALIWSAHLSRKSVEEWQLLAWLPPIPMVVWWIWLVIAVLRDPTSHNLWPFELLFWTLASAALFVAFLVGRGIAARSSRDWPAR